MIELKHKQTGRILYRVRADSLDRCDLHGTRLNGVDLRAMRLRGANLRRARLAGADLSDAIAIGADLQRAVFNAATLRRTDLCGADLREANLRSADLRGVRLRGAQLDGANFEWAALQAADISGASVSEANFFGADLRGAVLVDVKGLHSATLTEAQYDEATRWPEDGGPLHAGNVGAGRQPPWQYSLRTLMLLVTAYTILLVLAKACIQAIAPQPIDLMFAAVTALLFLVLGILFLRAARKVVDRAADGAPHRVHEPSERSNSLPEEVCAPDQSRDRQGAQRDALRRTVPLHDTSSSLAYARGSATSPHDTGIPSLPR